jgi:hypothetical protein
MVDFPHPPTDHHARSPSSYQWRSLLRRGRHRRSLSVGPAGDPRVHPVGARAAAPARKLSDATMSTELPQQEHQRAFFGRRPRQRHVVGAPPAVSIPRCAS